MILICQTAASGIERTVTGEYEHVLWFDNHHDLLKAIAGVDDPERIPDLEALYRHFLWIKRPR